METALHANNIPDELMLNTDQTTSNYLSASSVTMTEQGSKHIPIAGGSDKCSITLTFV